MLAHLDDKASIGPNLALALMTLFYCGVVQLIIVIPYTALIHKQLGNSRIRGDIFSIFGSLFGAVLACLLLFSIFIPFPSQESVQTPNQVDPIEFFNGIRDKADLEGQGIREYELYDFSGDESFDLKTFVRLYTGILEDGHDGVGGIYVFDHDDAYWLENNTGLSENVKTMMANHKRNLSKTHYGNPDGSTKFIFNYLNPNGKYEFYSVDAHIRDDTNLYSKKEDYDKAIADYTEIIRLDPESAKAYINRGLAYYLNNEYDKAIADYNEAIRLDPESAEPYSHRALVYYWKGDYDKTIADYTEAIQLNPKNKAIADLTEALRLNPENAETYIERGWVYWEVYDYDKAIADFTEAIRLDAKNAEAYAGRGLAYYMKEDYDKAIAGYTEVIRLDPENYEAYYFRGSAYSGKGDYDRAIADYKAALRIDPNNAYIKQGLEETQQAQKAAGKK